jgi:hypothetical protein
MFQAGFGICVASVLTLRFYNEGEEEESFYEVFVKEVKSGL